jgi:hypothetical protein
LQLASKSLVFGAFTELLLDILEKCDREDRSTNLLDKPFEQ